MFSKSCCYLVYCLWLKASLHYFGGTDSLNGVKQFQCGDEMANDAVLCVTSDSVVGDQFVV